MGDKPVCIAESLAVADCVNESIKNALHCGVGQKWNNVKVKCREVRRTWVGWITGKPKMWETAVTFELLPEPPEVT